MSRQNCVKFVVVMTLTAAVMAGLWSVGQGKDSAKPDPALDRTRREVRLLDDIYKTAVVLITTHYVKEDSDLAAGPAAKALFAAMKDKGWHEVRLLDATGEPLSEENSPRDDFEKAAIKALKADQPYFDQIVTKDGKRYLRAATPVPVVLEKCHLCHDNYKGQKVIGALGYTLPILDEN